MDDADKADGLIQAREREALAAVQRAAKNIPEGRPGDCDLCGEWSGRLVQGVCARCRDKYRLK